MVAIQGHSYAMLREGTVHWIFTAEDLSHWADNVSVIDITDYSIHPEFGWILTDGVLVPPPSPILEVIEFNTLKENKSLEISGYCEVQILSGFNSGALGINHLYPSNDRDQVNLSGTIQKSLLPSATASDYYPFLCADANGVWDYRLHTAAQIQQVGTDAYNAILSARIKNATLQAQISAATTQSELDAIQW